MIRFAGVLLLLPLAASAESVRLFDPPHPDNSPTAFACSTDTLASGEQCVFEGAAGTSASAEKNREALRALSAATCNAAVASASASDQPALRESCLARLNAAAERCAREGALLDEKRRFTAEGKACYRALADARAQAESLAHAAPGCCECLAAHRCGGAGSACVEQAARATLSVTCASDACVAECAELVSSAPAPASNKSNVSARGKRAK